MKKRVYTQYQSIFHFITSKKQCVCYFRNKYYQGSDLKNCDLFISFPVHFAKILLKIAKESLTKNLAHYSSGA